MITERGEAGQGLCRFSILSLRRRARAFVPGNRALGFRSRPPPAHPFRRVFHSSLGQELPEALAGPFSVAEDVIGLGEHLAACPALKAAPNAAPEENLNALVQP